MKVKLYILPLLVVAGLAMAAVTAQADTTQGFLSSGLGTGPGLTVTSPPTASPIAGQYTSTQNVTLTAGDTATQSIYYTTDGSTPVCGSGTAYSSQISVTTSETINAVSCYADSASSTVASFAYSIVAGGNGGGSSDSGNGGSGGGSSGSGNGSSNSSSIASNLVPRVEGASTTGAHPDGTLVISGSTVYIIQNGQLHGFRDPQEFASYGYRFSQTVAMNDADQALPTGSIMKAMAGTLVLDTSDNRTIYMVGDSYTKRGFISEQVYQGLGYAAEGSSTSNQEVNGVFRFNVSDYTAGAPITSFTAAHPDGALVLDSTGTVWWILDGQRDGFESETVFNTYGFTFDRVVPANAADMALPTGPIVKLRDGTLVLDGSTYYVISDGLKLPFASSTSLTNWGYSLANVVTDDISGYTAGVTLP